MLEVKFYDTVDDSLLKFAGIISQSNGKWVFCKHKERDTYEVPGGHREPGENILETAKRELQEETGAVKFEIKPICVYSVIGKTRVNNTGEESFGLLCFAEITEFAKELHSEEDRTRPLTEEGKKDSRIVQEFLQDKNIAAFYCSPYKRSVETIADTAAFFEKEIVTDERLREREKGPCGNNHGMFQKRWADHNYHE